MPDFLNKKLSNFLGIVTPRENHCEILGQIFDISLKKNLHFNLRQIFVFPGGYLFNICSFFGSHVCSIVTFSTRLITMVTIKVSSLLPLSQRFSCGERAERKKS
jgi:hypothetical protein